MNFFEPNFWGYFWQKENAILRASDPTEIFKVIGNRQTLQADFVSEIVVNLEKSSFDQFWPI